MLNWKAWMQRPSGLIKVGSTSIFKRGYLD